MESKHFGERWGRHWLDSARYADSDGYEKDNTRPNAWIWRSWVIESINNDMPFDQFTAQQISGDLEKNTKPNQILATAFHSKRFTIVRAALIRKKIELKEQLIEQIQLLLFGLA